MDLKDKNIIITGGSLGIGKSTAINLLNRGANVLVTGRSIERLSKVFKGTKVQFCAFDISDFTNLNHYAQKIIKNFNNRVDVLINNAGIGYRKSIDELTIDSFLEIFNVNVFGLSLFTKEIVPLMKRQEFGTIINIGSTASLRGYKEGSIYASSKFAVRCLTQCWQAELRPFNIRVCQINPSEVTTAFGDPKRVERKDVHNKLTSNEISHAIISSLEMDNRGFINELNVWATNPFN
ncbi:MAG: short-chain dehydrogenase [Flavobacteriales bacterium]|nr:short-chain dehydrogenase [Flavobacteriales bacterium]